MSKLKEILTAIFAVDKVAHFAICAVICLLLGAVTFRIYALSEGACIWFPFLITLAIGGIKEFVDGLLPNHSADWRDLIADAVGALVGVAGIMVFVL